MTPEQKERKNEIFTAEKIIDVSKAISNEKRLQDSIASLELKLKKAQDLITSQQEELQNYLSEITYLTAKLEQCNALFTKVTDNHSDKEKVSKNKLQLSPYLFLQDFNYKRINFSLNLTYTIDRFYFKLVGGTFSTPNLELSQRQLYSTIGIGYNLLK